MITAIIQCRMGSSRLPGKTLIGVEGKPLLWHLLERVKKSKFIEKIVIATTFNTKDKSILDFAKKNDFEAYQGNENDVLDRFYKVAKRIKTTTIVRITPDCPLVSPDIIDKVISEYLKGKYDYVSNTLLYTYPDGCDVEAFSFRALEKAWKECRDKVRREHVTTYIRDSGKFKLKNIENDDSIDSNEYKWSVDKQEDLEFVKEVFKYLYKKGKVFLYKDIMSLLKLHPQLKLINSKAMINEGFYKSIIGSPRIKSKKILIKNSLALKKKTERLIPDCSQTFSKGPSQFIQGVAPVFLEKGRGSHVWDVDGNEFIDYAMALGPIILGHNYPSVSNSVMRTLKIGNTFTLPHRLETELAELLNQIIPCAEMVRFGKNGSDATSGAVRVARAYTGRDKIACCGYHGWQDWYIASTTRNKGIPEEIKKLTLTFEYNKIESLEKIFKENKNQIACVIMEPIGINEPKDNFLQKVKKLAHKNSAVLIFDEIVTGFRLSLGGAQQYFNVLPDLACFGKAMGNGYPISAIVGKREIMRFFDDIFYSFTFGGEIISIAAAIATIKEFKKRKVIKYLWEQGRKIRDGYNVLAKEYDIDKYTQCLGLPPRTVITFKDKNGNDDLILRSLFQQECIKRGILFTGVHNICFTHSNEDVDYTLRVYRTVLEIVKKAIGKNKVKQALEGKPVKPIFRRA